MLFAQLATNTSDPSAFADSASSNERRHAAFVSKLTEIGGLGRKAAAARRPGMGCRQIAIANDLQ
jgi:hypothetical protein